MRNRTERKNKLRDKRKLRVRKHLRGNAERPRLCVVKSNAHIHVQLINDEEGKTLASTSTLSKEFRNTEFNKRDKNSARKLGTTIGEQAKKLNIKALKFDRGPFKYHGVLHEVAEGAREAGISF